MQRILTLLLLLAVTACSFAQVNIWEGTACKKKVMLTPYLTEGKPHMAVIVCPGGSYFWHDIEVEGYGVAEWLQRNGISAFVLNYRTGYVPAFITHYRLIFRGNRYPDPQDDLLQAVRYVRQHAAEYGIDPARLGAMGFSAGGHLVMSGAEWFTGEDRLAFAAPIYPVVTMTHPCVHKRSRRGLLGEHPSKAMKDSLSLEHHVPANCPPVFLMNCDDDPIVHYHNAELLDSALTVQAVPHHYEHYRTGGHGFGTTPEKTTSEAIQWKERFLVWLRNL